MFANGAFSRDSRNDPLRVDAERLARLTPVELAMGFQVRGHNSLLGLEGRAELLRKLGGVGLERPGMLFDLLAQGAEGSREIKAESILAALLDRLAAIWPSRLELDGVPLGDVWRHPSVGLVPFHKLSQWMSYSLVEPLEGAGLSVVELDALTAGCWSIQAHSGPSRRFCWRRSSRPATRRLSNGARSPWRCSTRSRRTCGCI